MRQRNTQQKQIISEVLTQAKNPLTVHEILALARKKHPAIGIATIYREISRLVEEKTIRTVLIPEDPTRYETTSHHHHHFKCTNCNTVFELEGCLDTIQTLLPKGFTHTDHEITLYGRCKKCA